jgi:general secretion pathway protein A
MGRIYQLSKGVPRLINILCDRALLGAFVKGKNRVSYSILTKAARETFGTGRLLNRSFRTSYLVLFLLIFIFLIAIFVPSDYIQNVVQQTAPSSSSETPTFSWTDDGQKNLSKQGAYLSLFRQWDIAYDPRENVTACRHALNHGMSCLNTRGSLGSLRNLNRPAVLQLLDNQGRVVYAALISLSGDSATFYIGKKTLKVSLTDLESLWLGNFTLLWKKPPEYTGILKPGEQGPMVQWLDRKLALIQGQTPHAQDRSVYEEDLVKQVKAFQRDKGLIPDGIVGTKTIIHINTASHSRVPLLAGKRGVH